MDYRQASFPSHENNETLEGNIYMLIVCAKENPYKIIILVEKL